MKKSYEVIETETGKVIKATAEERTLWIPLDPANSDYAEYLRYTAWVEAGNNPEDFWVQEQQADALVEQPKEEE